QLVEQPTTKLALQRLEETFDEATPLAAHVVPAQTVCNYWNYLFTILPENISARDQVGFNERVVPFTVPQGETNVGIGPLNLTVPGLVQGSMGGYSGIATNGRAGSVPDPAAAGEFQPYTLPILHDDPYGPTGQPGPEFPDCQSGQTGYALGAMPLPGLDPSNPAAIMPDLPGSRGPTTAFFHRDGTREYIDTRVLGRWPNP
ncbi:MAG TPA: hypothetical protein VEK39_07820, partial [Solirubrobacterales bacterium]|nr:hypothetical protein [Solirubrobacterales bacterium]